ncbi:MAG TPA: thioredoxin domain-containing protein, partial [Ilumatobacteraceae bacterium]|nr:thioredoxin domain-containing protein [Ilumatobacteraceae bacterium]
MNRLATETSPYLRQHADNPVDWYPWGDEAFAAAQARDVPVLLSIGYSACHWCHVMAHECFEDAEVAAVMNEHFVSIKLDREERPDVDAVYMEAIQAMGQRGGWPLTVFLTPDRMPFYGGTYYPKPLFLQLMAKIDEVWHQQRAEVTGNTQALFQALSRSAATTPTDTFPTHELVNSALQGLGRAFDSAWGGFGTPPKFPSTMNLDLVIRAFGRRPTRDAATVFTTTLDAMASGGMYDHIGGGFARYSVDREWLVPHFEKMLYDQALLARVYLHGWQVTGNEHWRQVVEETIGYVLTDMTHPLGGFLSAEDADSLGPDGHSHEGAYSTWTPDEVVAVLGPELGRAANEWYGITAEGNFESRSIPNRLAHRGGLIRPPEIDRARTL